MQNKIIIKTIEHIIKYGVYGLGINEVVRELGVSKGAFYHYYSSKNHLIQAVITEVFIKDLKQVWHKGIVRSANSDDASLMIKSIYKKNLSKMELFIAIISGFSHLDLESKRSISKEIKKLSKDWEHRFSRNSKGSAFQDVWQDILSFLYTNTTADLKKFQHFSKNF